MNNQKIQKEFILWLPMNKDFFGFKGFKKAPLNAFKVILKDDSIIEEPLYEIIKSKYKDIDIEEENGQRKIVLEFNEGNEGKKYKVHIYSNGLYHFIFYNNIENDNFIEIINNIFDLNSIEYISDNNSNKSNNLSNKLIKNRTLNLSKYNGILTYSQIEILLNGLYDENIFPSFYFNDFNKNNQITDKIVEIISFKNIFRSIILEKINDSKKIAYKPISGSRKIYFIENNNDVEELFSISMEQFIRVANTFSLEHYKRGLDFCLKQLSRLGTMKSFNQNETTKNFIAPSLNKLKSSIASLEAYQTMIFEKLPIIEYISELLEGLTNTIDDKKNVKKGVKEALRQYKRRIFIIKRYFKNVEDSLNIENQKNIQYELSEIRKYNEINSEMTTNNILSYQQDIDAKEQVKLNKLMYLITLIAVIFTIVSPIISFIISERNSHFGDIFSNMEVGDYLTIFFFIAISFGTGYFIINKNIFGYTISWYPKTKEQSRKILSFIKKINIKDLAIVRILKKCNYLIKKYGLPIPILKKYKPSTIDNNQEIFSRHIFENANPYSSYSTDKSNKKFNKYIEIFEKNFGVGIQRIPSLLEPNQCVQCIKFDSFQEKFPTFKLYKFSFYSKEEKGNRYILHLDIEFDFHRKITTIVNIRLVVLRNQDNKFELMNIHDNAEKIKRKFYDIIHGYNENLIC